MQKINEDELNVYKSDEINKSLSTLDTSANFHHRLEKDCVILDSDYQDNEILDSKPCTSKSFSLGNKELNKKSTKSNLNFESIIKKSEQL